MALWVVAFAAATAHAQDLEPRAYSNTPIGVNFLIATYGYSDGGLSADPTVPLTNAKVTADTFVAAYVRSLGLWGRSAKINVALPYAWTSGTAEFAGESVQRNVPGLLDPSIRFSISLYGAPALTLREFAGYHQDLIIGASVQLRPPLGQYDADKVLNNGSNRWSVKPELGLSKAWGPWRFELAGAVNLISDNRDFLVDKVLEQDPIYSVQGHLIYDFASGVWIAADATWYTGGRTSIDGVQQDNKQRNTRAGLNVALPLGKHHSIKLYGITGVATRIGSDSDIIGIAWQYRWGGGL